MISGHPVSTGFPQVDGLSTGPPGFGGSHNMAMEQIT